MHYLNHLESVYCMSGRGEAETLADGKRRANEPRSIYILDHNDEHILRAFEELKLACVFNSALTGDEGQNADGAYDLPE